MRIDHKTGNLIDSGGNVIGNIKPTTHTISDEKRRLWEQAAADLIIIDRAKSRAVLDLYILKPYPGKKELARCVGSDHELLERIWKVLRGAALVTMEGVSARRNLKQLIGLTCISNQLKEDKHVDTE